MVLRRASHAGSWYNGTKESLKKQLSELFTNKDFGPGEEPSTLNLDKRTMIGGVSPHAGVEYSGSCAAFTYSNLFKERIPETVIILGTDHVGYGKVALFGEGEWETPFGNLQIDSELSQEILNKSNIIVEDSAAFLGFMQQEHNIEIQLPFIKYCANGKDVKIVTIKMGGRRDYNVFEKIALAISSAINILDRDVVLIASSDMSHKNVLNIDQLTEFKKIDQDVVGAFVDLDPQKTFAAASKTTVCGAQTITTLMLTCKKLGANRGKLLKYYTSSDIRGGYGYCVGYFSGIMIKGS